MKALAPLINCFRPVVVPSNRASKSSAKASRTGGVTSAARPESVKFSGDDEAPRRDFVQGEAGRAEASLDLPGGDWRADADTPASDESESTQAHAADAPHRTFSSSF